MSEALRGALPDLDEGVDVDPLVGEGVYVIADRSTGGGTSNVPLTGVLRSILFDTCPEVEMRIELAEAFAVVQAHDLVFRGFELHHGQATVRLPGPFTVKAARIEEIDVQAQLCVLLLHLQRKKA